MKTSWRITPAPHIAAEVRQLALSEGRSDSAMLERLVGEALQARRRADSGVAHLVTILKRVSTEPAP
jgi:hypothetical protein